MNPKRKSTPCGNRTCKEVEQTSRSLFVTKIIAGFALLVTLATVCWPKETEYVKRQVVVHQGQTLWGIAEEMKADGDLRTLDEIVFEIRQDNKLDGYIRAGDRLVVWQKVLKKRSDAE